MAEQELLLDTLVILGAALVGGFLARGLRLPTILGFIVAGMLVGPGTPGPVGDVDNVRRAADLGVIMLMFSVGIQFSFAHLIEYRRVIFFGGGLQILATVCLGFVTGQLLGLDLGAALVVGFFAANTSTVVLTKVLAGRREVGSDYGAASTNISVLQDISAVVMIIAVPSLAGGAFATTDAALAIPKGLFLIAVTYFLSTQILPRVWQAIAKSGSREVSLLAGLVLAFGLASGSASLGLSIAFGAFLAGLALSENRFGYLTLSDIVPLREIFASVFFVSMGMLIAPDVLWQAPITVLALVLLVVFAKAVLGALALRAVGFDLPRALVSGVLLAQVGEFSFVIASQALDDGVIGEELASAFLVAAVISILLSPGLFSLTLARFRPEEVRGETPPRGHAVICGYDQSAKALIRALSGRGFGFVMVDTNPDLVNDPAAGLSEEDLLFGDPLQPEVLALAGVQHARCLAIAEPYSHAASRLAEHALSMNPRIAIVSIAADLDLKTGRLGGLSELVNPSLEGSMELTRRILHLYGVAEGEIRAEVSRQRLARA
jgi:CPA2 family monovalent cation:H+ antiporter-2